MRYPSCVIPAALLALALSSAASAPARAQQQRARTPTPSQAPAATPSTGSSDAGYSSRESDFVVGRRVYLRSTKTFIGTIRDTDADHPFPADRFPRARMKAVLIVRRDGPREWTPVERISRIYVVK